MLELGGFLVISAALIYLSRASLLRPRSHGFYRFFAWESLLALCLLNLRRWFVNPWSIPQLISWLLLLASAGLAIHGAAMLGRRGKPRDDRGGEALIGFERTTVLVAEGAYRYIRHPLYSSLLVLGWGIFFKDLTWLGGTLAAVATLFLVITAKVEEAEDVRYFGPAYQEYMRRTKLFIPFVF